jgi:hypothetical protein
VNTEIAQCCDHDQELASKEAKGRETLSVEFQGGGNLYRENIMKYHTLEDEVSLYQSNIRAEDGLQQNGQWNALCEGILIPFGFIVAFLVVVLIIMLKH